MAQQQEFWEELNVKYQWFHVVRSMIIDGTVLEIGTTAFCVYCAIKSYTALDTGYAWPSQLTLSKKLGISVDTVARSTKKLIDRGLVMKIKQGNKNMYKLTEEIPMADSKGDVVATAKRDYSPMTFMNFVNELKEWAKDGNAKLDKNIKIVMNINVINQGDNSTVNIQQINVDAEDLKSDDRLALLAKRLKSL